MALQPPPVWLARTPLVTVSIDPAALVRVTRHGEGEPHFGRSAANQFDDHRRPGTRFGTCYLGRDIQAAFAETVLHDETPVEGRFLVARTQMTDRFAVNFEGEALRLADCTGPALKRMGADGSLSTHTPYGLTQRWGVAIHDHPDRVDGMLYMSRHVNTSMAVVLFDRVGVKLRAIERRRLFQPSRYLQLIDYPGVLAATQALGVDFI